MKKVAVAVASVLMAGASAAFAQDYYYSPSYSDRYYSRDYRDYRAPDNYGSRWARVIDTRYVGDSSAKQECWNPRAGHYEEVRDENKTKIGKGAAIGALAGGVLGHQVDQGGGTAAGAILGGILGHQLERRHDRRDGQDDLDFSRCRMMAGTGSPAYEVKYEYDGREYVTMMNHDPGRRLLVGEHIRPDGTPLDNVARWDPAYSGG